eukprot:scaffold32706_cov15-Prasinocladus_malaysianus.AAC.1
MSQWEPNTFARPGKGKPFNGRMHRMYDGVLGVLGGIEALAALKRAVGFKAQRLQPQEVPGGNDVYFRGANEVWAWMHRQ